MVTPVSFSNLKIFQIPLQRLLSPCVELISINLQQRKIKKHWDPKFKKLRHLKVIKVDLPDTQKFKDDDDDLTPEQIRSKLKEAGLNPPRYWNEKPLFISSTGGIFEPYVPPEGDGKASLISVPGAKQKLEHIIDKKRKSYLAIRKIRSYEEEFEEFMFVDEAQKIYIKAHELMTETKDPEVLRDFITEKALPEVLDNVKNKTIHWKFVESLEPPRIVHGRCTEVILKENLFVQLTVRFHTKQVLAVYDRFGRLLHGSEIIAKDVLEYVVFEKHLSNEYGVWRMHGKIIPDWMPEKEPTKKTYVIVEDEEETKDEVAPEITESKIVSQAGPTVVAA